MSRLTRLTILSAMTLGLVACGGAKLGGGKEGAAQAAFQASQAADRGSKAGAALVEQALASGAATVSLKTSCAKGGNVSLLLDGNNTTTGGGVRYTITYDNCNQDGRNEYNGSMETTITATIDPDFTGAAVVFGMKGKLTIEGEVSDFIDTDVRMTMSVTATSASSGNVSMTLDGSIKTSEGNYVYANESISIVAGELPKA
jgi:hypothetical protein